MNLSFKKMPVALSAGILATLFVASLYQLSQDAKGPVVICRPASPTCWAEPDSPLGD